MYCVKVGTECTGFQIGLGGSIFGCGSGDVNGRGVLHETFPYSFGMTPYRRFLSNNTEIDHSISSWRYFGGFLIDSEARIVFGDVVTSTDALKHLLTCLLSRNG